MLGLGLRPAAVSSLSQATKAPVLATLSPNKATFTTDAPAGTVIWVASNKTAGSTLSFTPNDGRVTFDNAGRLVIGLSAASAGTITGTITETLSTATGSPKVSPLTITVTQAVSNAYATRPVTTGTPLSSEVLTAYTGNLGAGAGQWYRSGLATGATSSTYTLSDADIGGTITYRYTPLGGTMVESAPTDAVQQVDLLTDASRNAITDAAGNTLTLGYNYAYNAIADASGNTIADASGNPICTVSLAPVQQQVRSLVPASSSSNTFNQLSLTTQPFTFAIADVDRYAPATSGVPFQVYAPNMSRVEIWTAGAAVATFVGSDALGYFRGALDLSGFANGPRWFEVHAYDKSTVGGSGLAIFAGFHLFLTGGTNANTSALPAGAAGLALQWQDDFTSLSVSRSNSQDATWYDQMPQGGNFGDQIFTSVTSPQNPFQTVGSFLRIREQYDPNYAGGSSGTKHWYGGLLSTAFPDGTTSVTVGHGYYEARVLLPFGSGTWPAFWLLDRDRLSDPSKTYTSREQDILEQYGPSMQRFTSSVHRYAATTRADTQTFKIIGTPDLRWEFHRIGWLQTPNGVSVYFDDVLVMTDTYFKTTGPNDALNFILLNLALTPGPTNAPETVPPGSYHDMLVDYVRYFA